MRAMILGGAVFAAAIALVPSVASAGTLYGAYGEYPVPQAYPFQRSVPLQGRVVIPPYDHAFRVRVYTTPPQQPFYNVPPYGVITPY